MNSRSVYNLHMLKAAQILVRLDACPAGSAAALVGCGQRALYLPSSPEAQKRATLPETLNPPHPNQEKTKQRLPTVRTRVVQPPEVKSRRNFGRGTPWGLNFN